MLGLDFLKTVDIFQGLNDEQLSKLLAGCSELEYEQGNRLFAEGETAEHVWIVIDGRVDLRFDLPGRQTSDESTVSTTKAAKTLGWSSFVPPYQYKLSAYCASRTCKILQLQKEFLFNFFESDTDAGYTIMYNLSAVASSHFHSLQEAATVAPASKVKITVHMATCGIAAGAREVMKTLVDEIARADRPDIQVASSGCISRCDTEPNITVEIHGQEPVIYQKMNSAKMKQVFKEHVLEGETQSEFMLI